MSRGLRAGDALHLAVALGRQCSYFFSLDHQLNRHAQTAGLRLVTL
jgi:predicted nucleic acid-binding protein